MEKRYIFYSWQGDDEETADSIESSLKEVIDSLQLELGNNAQLCLDKDTHNELGSPDIASAILKKIDRASVFVADVSYVGGYNGRKAVNQNVMFETGYAFAQCGVKSVIMLFNKDKGRIKDLPFDISHHRVLTFSMKNDFCRQALKASLTSALRQIMATSYIVGKNEANRVLGEMSDEQKEIMRIIASCKKTKQLILTDFGIFGIKVWSYRKYARSRKVALVGAVGVQKIIADLNDLVRCGILRRIENESGRSVIFEPTKLGFDVIESLKD